MASWCSNVVLSSRCGANSIQQRLGLACVFWSTWALKRSELYIISCFCYAFPSASQKETFFTHRIVFILQQLLGSSVNPVINTYVINLYFYTHFLFLVNAEYHHDAKTYFLFHVHIETTIFMRCILFCWEMPPWLPVCHKRSTKCIVCCS